MRGAAGHLAALYFVRSGGAARLKDFVISVIEQG
jgi:hypothetical protein